MLGGVNLRLATSEDDLYFLYCVRKDPKVSKWLFGTPPKDLQSHVEYIKKVQGKDRWVFVAIELDRNRFRVGYSQIYSVTDAELEVGFAVMPKYWGKGYGTALVRETIKQAEQQFQGRKILLYVARGNVAAIKAYVKNGFKETKHTDPDVVKMER